MDSIARTPEQIAAILDGYLTRMFPEGIDDQAGHHEAGHPDLEGRAVEVAFDAMVAATDRAVREGDLSRESLLEAGWTPSPAQDALLDTWAARVSGCDCAQPLQQAICSSVSELTDGLEYDAHTDWSGEVFYTRSGARGMTAAIWPGETTAAAYVHDDGTVFLPADAQAHPSNYMTGDAAIGPWVEAGTGTRAVLLDGIPRLFA